MIDLCIALSHSSTWFWTQTAVCSALRYLPKNAIVVVADNSYTWSPSIRCITDTRLAAQVHVLRTIKPYKCHASGLDFIVEKLTDVSPEAELLMALETDVTIDSPDCFETFQSMLRPKDYAVGAWHHEQFINPSCSLYRMRPLLDMLAWCRTNPSPVCYFGPNFESESTLYQDDVLQQVGPFEERRGWLRGTEMKFSPSGKLKGPGHYEPGQALFHWATNEGYSFNVMPTTTDRDESRGIPVRTRYGQNNNLATHWWAGTRALEILKRPVTEPMINLNFQYWVEREIQHWRQIVPEDIQNETIKLVRQYGLYNRAMTAREIAAVELLHGAYAAAGVHL